MPAAARDAAGPLSPPAAEPRPPMETTPLAAETPRPWRKRHPVAARALLYGTGLALLAGGALVRAHEREEGRQQGMLTLLSGLDQFVRVADPEGALRTV